MHSTSVQWNDDKCERTRARGIRFKRLVGKLYGIVLIKRVKAETVCAIEEEHCGFRKGRGCNSRRPSLGSSVCCKASARKDLVNGKEVFYEFMDLEKAYDTIDWHVIWKMLRVYGVGRKLLKAVQGIYVDCG